jgi:hypothetical protein
MEHRDIFVSYIEEDGAIVRALVAELRALGQSTWTYEEDGVAGISYLTQVNQAIEDCQAFVLIASDRSVRAHQVIREVEQAHEREKVIIPVRIGLTHQQFIASNPILRMATGTAVSLSADKDNLSIVAKRIASALLFAPKAQVARKEPPVIAVAAPISNLATEAGPTGDAASSPSLVPPSVLASPSREAPIAATVPLSPPSPAPIRASVSPAPSVSESVAPAKVLPSTSHWKSEPPTNVSASPSTHESGREVAVGPVYPLSDLTSIAGLTPRDVPAEEMPSARSTLPYEDAQENQIEHQIEEDHLGLNDADGPATTPRISRRSFGIIVGGLALSGIALAVALSQIGPSDATPGNVPGMTVDLTRARFAIGIVEETGGKLRLVNPDQSLSERDVARAQFSIDQANRLAVTFVFTEAGAAKMKALTTTNVGKQMGFVSGSGEVLTAAIIEGEFSSDAQIAFPTSDEAQAFVKKLQSAVE